MRLIGLAVVLVLSLILAPLAVEAQPAGRQVKIGVLCAGTCPFGGPVGQAIEPLTTALERVGLVRGRTLAWDTFGVVNSEDQIAVEAQKLVSRRPDLILVWPGSVRAARAAKDATRTIPIVLMAVPDVVEHGLVDSLGRPGGKYQRHEHPPIRSDAQAARSAQGNQPTTQGHHRCPWGP